MFVLDRSRKLFIELLRTLSVSNSRQKRRGNLGISGRSSREGISNMNLCTRPSTIGCVPLVIFLIIWYLALAKLNAAPAFLDALAQAESKNNPAKVGDRGHARGQFQIHATAWADVTARRKARGLQTWRHRSAGDARVSRVYAEGLVGILTDRFTTATGHPPTERDLVCCWNLGVEGFRRHGFDLDQCPTSTKQLWKRFKQ